VGLQMNLPFSKQTGDVYWHWNAGLTWLAAADTGAPDRTEALTSPFLAASGNYRLRPMLHLMLESAIIWEQSATLDGTTRETFFTISPGARGGWNIGDRQLIVGAAIPITWDAEEVDAGGFVYLSYELPFKK
jgi:hypothetical protein